MVGWVFRKIDWDQKLFGFRIDIANIDTSLMCKENPITLYGQ